ncbi:MAG: acyl-ACP--UDP-N-acetylglucosamine O-acyltransferase [Epsilonproteobacteria bacterium]|nr:acyl-ACP--UDP-N-acetylglucosamine O-acyltransferase [Campylobacterota bacterium]
MSLIHPTAVIEEGAVLGDNVEIGPFSIVKKDAKLANGVKLHSHVVVDGYTDIGENTQIFPFSAIGTVPQDLSYQGEEVRLIIGKNNTIRENVLINPGTLKDKGETIIGDNNLLMGSTHVAHDAVLGNDIVMVNQSMVAGHVIIEDGVIIGGSTPIHQFVRLGEYSMIGGGGAVAQDIPPYCLAEGNRAVVKSLNLVGMRRRFEKSDISALTNAYKILFRSGEPLKESAEKLIQTDENEKVKYLCKFIMTTKRGIPYERK